MATRQDALAAPTAVELAMAGHRRPIVLAVIGLVALGGRPGRRGGVRHGGRSRRATRSAIILHRLLPLDLPQTWTATEETIVWELRLPRVLEAMIVGLGLAVAGTTFQGLLRNPLADPYVLGTASGAALGAAIAVLIPIRIEFLAFGLLQLLAFARRAAGDHRGLSAVADGRRLADDEPAPDRLRARLAPRRGAGDGDVPVRARPSARSSRTCSGASRTRRGASWRARSR